MFAVYATFAGTLRNKLKKCHRNQENEGECEKKKTNPQCLNVCFAIIKNNSESCVWHTFGHNDLMRYKTSIQHTNMYAGHTVQTKMWM